MKERHEWKQMKGVERMKTFEELTEETINASKSRKENESTKEQLWRIFARNAIKSKRYTAKIKYEIQRIVNAIKNKGC